MNKSLLQIIFLLILFESFLFKQSVAGVYNKIDLPYEVKQKEALALIETVGSLDASEKWLNLNASLFLLNVKRNVENPEGLYQGKRTNFCGYAALTYLLIKENPVIYVNSLLGLYHHGYVKYGSKHLNPGQDIRFYAGTLKNKGLLDSLHADQMWFLTLADQFKGFVNFFDHHFDKGDENTLWAGVNYDKFILMQKKLLGYKVETAGGDFYKPNVDDLTSYLQQHLQKGKVVLMANSRIKDHSTNAWIKLRLPVHYIVLKKVEETNALVTVEFWDYGGLKIRSFSKKRFKRAICSITTITNEDQTTAALN